KGQCGGSKGALRAFTLWSRAVEKSGAVLAVLDDEKTRAEVHHGAGGLHEVGIARNRACLSVIDEQDVEALEHFKQCGLVVLDPVIHGVAGNEFCVGRGLANAALQNGIDVGEEKKFGIAVG